MTRHKKPINIEDYEEARKFLDRTKTEGTRIIYRAALKQYVEFTGKNPKQLIDEIEADRNKPTKKQGKPEEQLEEFWKHTIKTKASMTTRVYVMAIKTFYKRNKFPLSQIELPEASAKPENEKRLLKPADVKILVDNASSARDRAVVLTLYQSGMDISTVCSLNYQHIKHELETEEIPLCIHLKRKKKNQKYFTFLGQDSVDMIRAMLNERRKNGAEIKLTDPLFCKEGKMKGQIERLTPRLIQRTLRQIALKTRMISNEDLESSDMSPIRPHSLRGSFSSILKLNNMSKPVVDFMLGHAQEYGGAYEKFEVEDVRQKYKELEHCISISRNADVGQFKERLNGYEQIISKQAVEMEKLKEHQIKDEKYISELVRKSLVELFGGEALKAKIRTEKGREAIAKMLAELG